MALPSPMLVEEDELLSVGTQSDQPPSRAPCATLYSGSQGYNGHLRPGDTNYTPNRASCQGQTPLTFSLIALDGTHPCCTLYFQDCDLTTLR
jgi:hypothetical protein